MKVAYNLPQLREERKYWKTVELSCLTEEQQNKYLKHKKAVDMYIDGFSIKQIIAETNLKGKSDCWKNVLWLMNLDHTKDILL